MIAHVVLFRPRPDLSPEEAAHVVNAIERAVSGAPAVRRAHIGRRVLVGRGYEQRGQADFPYAAILEFEDVDGLRAYLDHPAHQDVGGAIFGAADEILVYDFDMAAGVDSVRAAAALPSAGPPDPDV